MKMHAGVAQFGDEADVALDQARLRFRRHAAEAEFEGDRAGVHAGALSESRVFGVLDDAEAYARSCCEGFAHDAVFEDGFAIIGNGYGSGGLERGEVIERFAL